MVSPAAPTTRLLRQAKGHSAFGAVTSALRALQAGAGPAMVVDDQGEVGGDEVEMPSPNGHGCCGAGPIGVASEAVRAGQVGWTARGPYGLGFPAAFLK